MSEKINIPSYMGPEKQITSSEVPVNKRLTTDPSNPELAQQSLAQASEQADVTSFFQGDNPSDRPLDENEQDAFGKVVQANIAAGNAKVVHIPGLFNVKPNEQVEEEEAEEAVE